MTLGQQEDISRPMGGSHLCSKGVSQVSFTVYCQNCPTKLVYNMVAYAGVSLLNKCKYSYRCITYIYIINAYIYSFITIQLPLSCNIIMIFTL